MQPPKPPQIAAIDVVSAHPAQADSMALTHLSAHAEASRPPVAYVVKVKLKSRLPATSLGWALYVSDVRIPKYWEYEDGIYFTVIDPNFFAEHKGERLRFSHDGVEFHDTGIKLPGAPSSATAVADVSTALTAKVRTAAKPKRTAKAKAKKAKSKSKRKRT
ncbi:MAG TPA: hypothetical protein VN838_14480 [Bradyrhizobium sp.]|nr:hypothetical protein [Bradyrhizobium sp.]